MAKKLVRFRVKGVSGVQEEVVNTGSTSDAKKMIEMKYGKENVSSVFVKNV